jgi:ribosome-associated protein
MTNELMEELAKEKSLQRKTLESILVVETQTPFADLDEEVKLAIRSANEKKAFAIVALDLREVTSFAEFFVIASGSNQRQVQAISDEINEQLKKQLQTRPIRIEGYNSGEWILLDYGDFIIHIFEQKARDFYDLERLWRDAKKVEIPENI